MIDLNQLNREDLIKLNQQFSSLPQPNLDNFTEEDLIKRYKFLESMFEYYFDAKVGDYK